jgi:anti-sigma-K factor RskA
MSGRHDFDDDDMLASEYVLGVLPTAERQAVARRMEKDAHLRARVRFWDEKLVGLSRAVDPVIPPSQILKDIEAKLFAPTTQPSGFWKSLWLWRGLSLASLAGLIAVSALYTLQPQSPPVTGPTFASVIASDSNQLKVLAIYDQSKGQLRLERTSGEAVPGRDLELWLIAGSSKPVSLGVMPVSQTGNVNVNDSLKLLLGNAILAVSDEPKGGSPTGQPTGTVLATGKIISL